jgi:hypothetical protein
MMEILFYILLLAVALGLIVYRPLARWTDISIAWEIGAGALLVILFLIHVTDTFITPTFSEDDLAKKPCGASSPQGACYSLEHELCEKAWDNSDSQCKTEVAAILKDRPSAITGPYLNRCKARKMDQALRYNRTNTASPFCQAYFSFIQAK